MIVVACLAVFLLIVLLLVYLRRRAGRADIIAHGNKIIAELTAINQAVFFSTR